MKIICIGRNYAEHSRELNNPIPTHPVVFMKPSTALMVNDKPLYYPNFTSDLHYEGELVLRISRNGRCIEPQFAHRYYDAITVGIDFTARDLQQQCKDKGLPWEIAKAFDGSAPIGRWIPIADIPEFNPNQLHFQLQKNNTIVQRGCTADLLFQFDSLISYISRYFRLLKGDLLFTGTPAGVGPVHQGDRLEGILLGQKVLLCDIK